ncbi:MAG: TolC family protein [Planctomycetota bacterium]
MLFLFLIAGCGRDEVSGTAAPAKAASMMTLESSTPRTETLVAGVVEPYRRSAPILNSLIERSFASNLDLATAVQRGLQAAALRGIAAGERFPDLDGAGSYSPERQGQNGLPALTPPKEFESLALSLEFGWEFDAWGGVRRVVEATDADLAATIEDLNDVRLQLAADAEAVAAADLYCFRFVPLTTLGYDDVSPAISIAPSLAVLESSFGQIVVAALLGHLVSLQIAASPRRGLIRASPVRESTDQIAKALEGVTWSEH